MSKLYPLWKQELIKGSANSTLNGTVKAYLIDSGTFAQNDAHDMIDDVVSGIAQNAGGNAAITIDNKTYVNGVFDTSDVTDTFTALTLTATTYEALIIWIDTTVASTSKLVAYIDGFSAVTPNGGDVIITWDNVTDIDPTAASASGIFAI